MVYECGDEFCGAKLSSKSDSIPNVCSVSKLGRQIDTERMGLLCLNGRRVTFPFWCSFSVTAGEYITYTEMVAWFGGQKSGLIPPALPT
jgi:hypothetical protein